MKKLFYILFYLLCIASLANAQVKGHVFSTVQTFPGGNLRIHSNPMTLAAHIITPRNSMETSSVYFTEGSFVEGASNASYVNGYVNWSGQTSFSFPVGDQDGISYRPMGISLSNPLGIQLAVAYWKGDVGTNLDPTGGAHDRLSIDPSGTPGIDKIVSISSRGFWDWVPFSISGSDAVVRVDVSIADHSGVGGFAAPTIRLVGWNTTTGAWENLSGAIAPATNTEGTVVVGLMKSAGLLNYSAISIGSTESDPLPVTLISFNARKESSQVNLLWKTSEETNADYFQIERSPNAKDWNVIGKQSAAGESKAVVEYSFTDQEPLRANNYYRLKMVDNDASFAFSKIQNVRFENTGDFLAIYPNPVSDVLHIKDADMENLDQVIVHDISGREVYRSKSLSPGGIDVSKMANGFYLVTVKLTDGNSRTEKIVVMH